MSQVRSVRSALIRSAMTLQRWVGARWSRDLSINTACAAETQRGHCSLAGESRAKSGGGEVAMTGQASCVTKRDVTSACHDVKWTTDQTDGHGQTDVERYWERDWQTDWRNWCLKSPAATTSSSSYLVISQSMSSFSVSLKSSLRSIIGPGNISSHWQHSRARVRHFCVLPCSCSCRV